MALDGPCYQHRTEFLPDITRWLSCSLRHGHRIISVVAVVKHKHDMDITGSVDPTDTAVNVLTVAGCWYSPPSPLREQCLLENYAGHCEVGGKPDGQLELYSVEHQCHWEMCAHG